MSLLKSEGNEAVRHKTSNETILLKVTVVVMKYHDQKQVREGKVSWAYIFIS